MLGDLGLVISGFISNSKKIIENYNPYSGTYNSTYNYTHEPPSKSLSWCSPGLENYSGAGTDVEMQINFFKASPSPKPLNPKPLNP